MAIDYHIQSRYNALILTMRVVNPQCRGMPPQGLQMPCSISRHKAEQKRKNQRENMALHRRPDGLRHH